MKKFQFSLEKVLSYKQQKQEALRSEHAEILALVRAQEALVESRWERYREYSVEYRDSSATTSKGISTETSLCSLTIAL